MGTPDTTAPTPLPVRPSSGEEPAYLRLRIEPVVQRAEEIAAAVERDLPTHRGLVRAAREVAAAAHQAHRVSWQLRRLWGIHRMPAYFLGGALLLLAGWCYWEFFHVTQLSIALPARDAQQLHDGVSARWRIQVREVTVPGSREAAALVAAGDVDLAFVQGGIPIASELQRLETPRPEIVLMFVREHVAGPARIRRLLTSLEGEGSHSVARDFVRAWGIEPNATFVHDWTRITNEPDYRIPDDVDAVFAVKDPSSDATLLAVERLAQAGFRLAALELGARALSLDYLRPLEIPRGYLRSDPPLPATATPSYSVKTFLVARRGLTARRLAIAAHLLDTQPETIDAAGFEPSLENTGEMVQSIDSLLSIVVYIGLAFLTLLGVEIMTYRRRFHALNSLISLISMHQSSKDVLGIRDPEIRAHNLLYLSTCSDLLGLVSVIAGYYSQENASLLYNHQLSIIYERADSLKLNIQIKILHASVEAAAPVQLSEPPGTAPYEDGEA